MKILNVSTVFRAIVVIVMLPLIFAACERAKPLTEDSDITLYNRQLAVSDAIFSGNSELAKAMLSDPNDANFEHLATAALSSAATITETESGYAKFQEAQKLIAWLIETQHVSVNLQDKRFAPALLRCADHGNTVVAKYLIEHGADIEQVAQGNVAYGRNALEAAIHSGHLEIVELLISAGAKLDRSKVEHNLLHLAVASGNDALVRYLVDSDNYNLNEVDSAGETILWYSTKCKLSTVKYLIEHGANPELSGQTGESVLWSAVFNDDLDKFIYFIDCGVDPHAKSQCGDTAFVYAGWSNAQRIIEYMLDKMHWNLEERGKNDETVLVRSIKGSNVELVQYLITRGASPYSSSKYGNAFEIAAAEQQKADTREESIAATAIIDALGKYKDRK